MLISQLRVSITVYAESITISAPEESSSHFGVKYEAKTLDIQRQTSAPASFTRNRSHTWKYNREKYLENTNWILLNCLKEIMKAIKTIDVSHETQNTELSQKKRAVTT